MLQIVLDILMIYLKKVDSLNLLISTAHFLLMLVHLVPRCLPETKVKSLTLIP